MIKKMPDVTRAEYDNQPEQCFHDLLSGKGRLTIIRSLGEHDSLRYTELRQLTSDISTRGLSLQLKEMEELGLLVKEDYDEYPKHTEYQLTQFGRTLLPTIEAIRNWYANEYQSCDCKKICEDKGA